MAFMCPDEASLSTESQQKLPKVTVILAVKGVGEQGLANWKSQLVSMYGGSLEFLFCVESKDDAAYAAIQALSIELGAASNIRLVVAGLASHCSQQIHNQMAGAKASSPDSKYILFLDDDIQLHPGSIGELVRVMEDRPQVFVCTGYSFDIPSTPSLAAYAAVAYRLPLQIGMASGGKVFFVWGGCIFLRTEDLRSNRYGMMTALQQNGYSNDLILTSVAGQNDREVWSSDVSIFPGKMSGGWTFRRYWNYVRRQIFALLTYCSAYAYRTNRMGWVVYMYLSWALLLPLVPSLWELATWMASMSWALVQWIDNPVTAVATAVVGRSWAAWALTHATCPVSLALSAANVAAAGVLTLSGYNLFLSVVSLCNKLSPGAPQIKMENLSLVYAIGGMAVNLLMLPIIALFTYFKGDITWAGIRYVRRNGVVAKVTHPGEAEDVGEVEVRIAPGSNAGGKLVALGAEKQNGRMIGATAQWQSGKPSLTKLFPLHVEIAWNTLPGGRGQPQQKKTG